MCDMCDHRVLQDVLKESITYEDESTDEKTTDQEHSTSLSYSPAEVCLSSYRNI